MTDNSVWLNLFYEYCLAIFCLSITPQWLNTEIPDIVWQVLRDDPSVVPSGGWVCRRPRRRSVDNNVNNL